MRWHAPMLIAFSFVFGEVAEAQLRLPSWLGGSSNRSDYRVFQSPASAFSLEFPKRDWQDLPGTGAALVIFAQRKGEATVAIEHAELKQTLPQITETFANLEIEDLKDLRPGAQGFQFALRTSADGPVVVVEFSQTGARGAERVRQYSLPRGLHLFRVVCTASGSLFPKYEAIFEHMAATLKVAGPNAARSQ
jgi:hypothetical protein